tara:strand:- start:19 stop:1674 length:1656 start_codon:yes stop_codon:yes gene_type:complete
MRTITKSILHNCRFEDDNASITAGKTIYKKHIDKKDYKKISTQNKGTDRTVIALEKTHKPTVNGKYNKRLIINNAGSTTSELEKYLFSQLKAVEKFIPTLLKSPQELLGRFKKFTSPDNFELISTDIVDMYSSIDPKDAINCIMQFVADNKLTFAVPNHKIEKMLIDCLIKCTSVKVGNKYFKQTSGLKTGSPLSGLLADVYIYVHYEKHLILKNPKIRNYCRYRDDTIMVCQSDFIDQFLELLNNINKKISFTIEKCTSGTISFLDKELELCNNKLKSKWYRKEIKKDKMINFNAPVPFRWKQNAILEFLNRIIFSSYDDQTLGLDLLRMKRILSKNNYPFDLVTNVVNKHIDNFKAKRNILWDRISNNELHPKIAKPPEEKVKWFVKIPYTSPRLEKIMNKLKFEIKKSFGDIELNIIYTSRKLFSVFKNSLKPPLVDTEKQEVIYKFVCDCSDDYIGETGAILRYRIKQHFKNSTSSIHEHINVCDQFKQNASQHPINQEAHLSQLFSVIDRASNTTLRRIKESVYIHCNRPVLNDKVKDHVYHLYGI